jgi:hypothetical protein
MSKLTWVCFSCRKSYLRKKSLTSVECPKCHEACELIFGLGRVPSPRAADEDWKEFRERHEAYKASEKARINHQAEERSGRRKPSPTVKRRVSYVEAISKPLIQTLDHASALPVNQLAGHAANLDFWVSEAKHCLAVTDGYQDRFGRLRAGQAEYEKQHNTRPNASPIRRGTKDQARQELRQSVSKAIERFLSRCSREHLLSERSLEAAFSELGIGEQAESQAAP